MSTTATLHMSPCQDYETGYDVIDPRDGRTLAWRGSASSAAEIVEQLNSEYERTVLPAYDTLVHEIVGLRIAGVAG